MNWQVMSFVLVLNLAAFGLIVNMCLNNINVRRRQVLFTISFSALGGSAAGIVGTYYLAHYLTSLMLCLGVASLIADRLILWFESKSVPQQKQ